VEVDQARIVEIWNRFFENKMRLAMGEEMIGAGSGLMVDEAGFGEASTKASKGGGGGSGGAGGGGAGGGKKPSAREIGLEKGRQQRLREQQQLSNWESEAKAPVATSRSVAATATAAAISSVSASPIEVLSTSRTSRQDARVFEWFSWILCYSQQDEGETVAAEGYVIHKSTRATLWLSEHLQQQQLLGLYSGSSSSSSLPDTLLEAARQGWLCYYEHATNRAVFLNCLSWRCEAYLPLARDNESVALGMQICCEPEWQSWVEADPMATQAWVVCFTREMTATPSCTPLPTTYYFNRFSGHTSYEAPCNWNELKQTLWGGWVLCMSEESDWVPYWWHEASGESAWAEEAA